MSQEPYRQVLPGLELSIERYTENVPADGRWYLIRAGQELGQFRSLKAAQAAWHETVRRSGWKPRPSKLHPDQMLQREQMERWSRNRGG